MQELQKIQAALKAPKGQYNSFGKYAYRSCEDILEAVKPLLAANGCTLTITDEIVAVNEYIFVKATATLKNSSGETEATSAFARHAIDKKGMDDSQVTGSASSYARKYALNGLFCIDDTKDADATNDHGKTAHGATQSATERLRDKLLLEMATAAKTPKGSAKKADAEESGDLAELFRRVIAERNAPITLDDVREHLVATGRLGKDCPLSGKELRDKFRSWVFADDNAAYFVDEVVRAL